MSTRKYRRAWLPMAALVAFTLLSACTTDFCTRHSDCPPGDHCGATGVCVPEPLKSATVDGGASADGMAGRADAMANVPDAMASSDAEAGSDAMPSVDGGAEIADAGLAPPADADLGVDAEPFVPAFQGSGVAIAPGGGAGMTVLLDGGLSP